MNLILKWSGSVALVILAILWVSAFFGHKTQLFGTATDCSQVTCFTTVGVLTSFQDDGTAIFNGVVTFAAAITNSAKVLFTGGVYASSTIQTSGPLINYTTDSATSSTKLGCIQTTATSTATPIRLVLGAANTAASSTFNPGSAGFVNWGFGTCP